MRTYKRIYAQFQALEPEDRSARMSDHAAMTGMPHGQTLAPQHPDWEAHGTLVTTCKEYAYKRYYDYARFEEAAATCAGNDDCIYDVAMRNDNPGLGMRLTMYDAPHCRVRRRSVQVHRQRT